MDKMEKTMRVELLQELMKALKGQSLSGMKPKDVDVTVVKGDPELVDKVVSKDMSDEKSPESDKASMLAKMMGIESEEEDDMESEEDDMSTEEPASKAVSKEEWLKRLKAKLGE